MSIAMPDTPPQLIPAGAFFQLLQAYRPLAHQPLVDGGNLPAQSLPRQLYPFAAGFQPVKFLQQLAAGGVRRLRDIRPLILPLRQKGKVRLFAAQQQRGAAAGGQCRRPFPQYGGNGGPLHRGKGANRRIARGNAVGKLPANEGGSPLRIRRSTEESAESSSSCCHCFRSHSHHYFRSKPEGSRSRECSYSFRFRPRN